MNELVYIAHIDEYGVRESVKEHCEKTALKCSEFACDTLKDIAYNIGIMHDIGKYQNSFQRRIRGEKLQVEHSGCGAKEVIDLFEKDMLRYIMGYCIAGHHSGIPDGGNRNDVSSDTTLNGRIKRSFEDYSQYKEELQLKKICEEEFVKTMIEDCDNNLEILIDKFAFLTRYLFSCLTDADTLKTIEFCSPGNLPKEMKSDFRVCLRKIEKRLDTYSVETELQKARAILQRQVFGNKNRDAEVYLINMPTGSGKTLCSMKFALERALMKNKKRIIYVIPYNSIIDQTAEEFENIFGESAKLLRHQSNFSVEDKEDIEEDYIRLVQVATENWDAQVILTTSVQFFESVYSNKKRKLRKLHNMSDSIIVFDEVHLMPVEYLQPCLQAVMYISKYLNSESVFLTATMPDYKKLFKKYALPECNVLDLVENKKDFGKFRKCYFKYIGILEAHSRTGKIDNEPSTLIVVNKRKTARELYSQLNGQKYHLSTYMTPYDREKKIREIKIALQKLEDDYPGLVSVPDDRKITVVSTSLIEAGVDLDFHTVYRELTGLDSILQAGGRCNREGKRKDAATYIFELEENMAVSLMDEKTSLTKGLLEKYEDISVPECITEYYERLYDLNGERITSKSMHNYSKSMNSIKFKEYAENFHLIKEGTESIVIEKDEKSKILIQNLKYTGKANLRKLEKYSCTVYQNELSELIKQNVIDDFDSGIYCLINNDYYDEEIGILFEGKDYII